MPAPGVSLRAWRYARSAILERAAVLRSRGAVAMLFISDALADSGWSFGAPVAMRGSYGIDTAGPPAIPRGVPVLWVRRSVGDRAPREGARLTVDLEVESFLYPSVNVVARVAGRDSTLRHVVVVFSAHQDHDGVRGAVAGDSIYNGADDNASASVALLAIARAFARQPGKRSALFVWHGAEERGLLGSRWHARHPVVPAERIVAVLNADMIGSNHPDSAAFLGAQPPHRNSTELAAMGLEANARVSRFQLDTLWDRPTHPEGWYFRSDHLPYARAGIPAIYFSTLPHRLYHTPADQPASLNIAKLARVTRWMYATGWLAAEAAKRPALDPGFRLER
jgi:Zn-dependent M28 family amino/carboxypeptidase